MKSIPKPQFRIAKCPMCDSTRIRWVCKRCVFEIGERRVTSPRVPHWHCPDCGERLFDGVSEEALKRWRESASANRPVREPRGPLGGAAEFVKAES